MADAAACRQFAASRDMLLLHVRLLFCFHALRSRTSSSGGACCCIAILFNEQCCRHYMCCPVVLLSIAGSHSTIHTHRCLAAAASAAVRGTSSACHPCSSTAKRSSPTLCRTARVWCWRVQPRALGTAEARRGRL
ncbi:hypothetical protein COO60DRAFT_1528882 [Scenedesmus sp. NREL 46B-D3]|nr:hypothetical protein COO60DRAFT_1528882 [Scenedesmus sp. NREL 46B-D3]